MLALRFELSYLSHQSVEFLLNLSLLLRGVQVLRWLKQWDPCVFGSKRYSTSEEVLTSLRRQATHLHGNVNMGGRGSFNNNVNKSMAYRNDTFNSDSTRKVATEEKSTLDRPEEKV